MASNTVPSKGEVESKKIDEASKRIDDKNRSAELNNDELNGVVGGATVNIGGKTFGKTVKV